MTDPEVAFPTASPPVEFGVDELVAALADGQTTVSRRDAGDAETADVRVGVGTVGAVDAGVGEEGYRIERHDGTVVVAGGDETGAMYGALELAERVRRDGLDGVAATTAEPEVAFRALKFNLPWSPYRSGGQTDVHLDTCRDIDFWETFLDRMAHNRFNALTLWNLHPFPYMVRPEGYPEACPFDDEELERWQSFWHDLFRMADERGIDTYVLNWNVVVSPSFAAAYDAEEFNDTSEQVIEYTRECVRATVDEYPRLTGLGVSLCDWMEGMSPAEKQDWFEEAILAGIADADRAVELLDRSVLTESIPELRRGIESAAALENVSRVRVPTKFNWSHGHSTSSLELTHDYGSGEVDDRLWEPAPENYTVAWTVRNEDFFVLRWGDPDFVREHVADNHADRPAVDGYVIGSEGYIPAAEYAHRTHRHRTWQYAFQRQWLFYATWGRLLYDPEVPDATFEALFDQRYRPGVGADLLEGYRAAGDVPEAIASFHAGTWDYTLYSEGFLALAQSLGAHDGEPFISVDELIDHETLDSSLLSISDYLDGAEDGVTPPELADSVEESARGAQSAADAVAAELDTHPGALACELADLRAWGHLGQYFAAKLRGAVALARFRRTGEAEARARAVARLKTALEHWDDLVAVTEPHYREVPYARDFDGEMTFSWARFREAAARDVEIAREATAGAD
jgi:hypothetical protein